LQVEPQHGNFIAKKKMSHQSWILWNVCSPLKIAVSKQSNPNSHAQANDELLLACHVGIITMGYVEE